MSSPSYACSSFEGHPSQTKAKHRIARKVILQRKKGAPSEASCEGWQPDRGSNPDRLDQNQVCYHYTIRLLKAA